MTSVRGRGSLARVPLDVVVRVVVVCSYVVAVFGCRFLVPPVLNPTQGLNQPRDGLLDGRVAVRVFHKVRRQAECGLQVLRPLWNLNGRHPVHKVRIQLRQVTPSRAPGCPGQTSRAAPTNPSFHKGPCSSGCTRGSPSDPFPQRLRIKNGTRTGSGARRGSRCARGTWRRGSPWSGRDDRSGRGSGPRARSPPGVSA